MTIVFSFSSQGRALKFFLRYKLNYHLTVLVSLNHTSLSS